MGLALFYWVFSVSCWSYCLFYGGRTALCAFGLFTVATAGTWLASANMYLFQTVNVPLFSVDFAYFVSLYVLALRSKLYWPIWSAGFQLLCVLTHFGPLLDPGTDPDLYLGLESVWALPMLCTMMIGISKDRQIGPGSKGGRNDRVSATVPEN